MVSGGKSKKGAIKILESSKDIQENWNDMVYEFVKNTEKQLEIEILSNVQR